MNATTKVVSATLYERTLEILNGSSIMAGTCGARFFAGENLAKSPHLSCAMRVRPIG
jgi:hypothetical protein